MPLLLLIIIIFNIIIINNNIIITIVLQFCINIIIHHKDYNCTLAQHSVQQIVPLVHLGTRGTGTRVPTIVPTGYPDTRVLQS